jgi:hypothetical protein
VTQGVPPMPRETADDAPTHASGGSMGGVDATANTAQTS